MEQDIERLRQQQALLAKFGSFAFRESNLQAILNEAAFICAVSLGAERAKICKFRQDHNDLLIVAGFGWDEGVVNQVVSKADESTPQGRAWITGEPVICNDISTINGFVLPEFYRDHHVVSTVDVVITGLSGPPFGILEVDNTTPREYDAHDIDFLTGFANVLAEAVATASRVEGLRGALQEIKRLLAEKEQLLDDKSVMAQEVQHRVRNNLQLVSGMIADQLRRTSEMNNQAELRGILSRVAALAKVHDHLLGVGLTRTIDFSEYVQRLCGSLPDLQPDGPNSVVLKCKVPPMVLDLNVVTSVGLAVTELVANSYRHAFPDRSGRIVIAGGSAPRSGWGWLEVSDDGIGLESKSPKNKRHGLGLVHRLVEQVSGTLELVIGSGTAWRLTFPLSADYEHSADSSAAVNQDRLSHA